MPDFNAKCTKIDFGCGSAPVPAGELTALPRPLAGFKGPTSKGKGGEGKGEEERKGKGYGVKGRGREGEGRGGREEKREGGGARVGWSPLCEILNTPLSKIVN